MGFFSTCYFTFSYSYIINPSFHSIITSASFYSINTSTTSSISHGQICFIDPSTSSYYTTSELWSEASSFRWNIRDYILSENFQVIDFIDLEEIDNDDAKMRIIAQSLFGEVKKWFFLLIAGLVGTSQ